MSRPLRIQIPGACYHVLSRGLEKRSIFRKKKDYETFQQRLLEAHSRYKIQIYAFCLMPNHYHLLIKTILPNLSIAMKHINGSYLNYFNRAHKRVGPLFQGRFKAFLVEESRYGLILSRYIHQNPVKAKLASSCMRYPYSSFRYWVVSMI